MSLPARLWKGWRGLFQNRETERELDEELRFHLEMEIERQARLGCDPATARRRALRSFGGVEKVKEECRDQRSSRPLETLLQDVRYAVRTLRNRPAFTLAALLTLALGIGANTAIFSVVNAVMLRPLPFAGGDRLARLRQAAPLANYDDVDFSVKDLADYRAMSRTLERVAEYHSMSFILLGGPEPERVQTGVVSADFFEVFGVRPYLGRSFLPGEDRPGAEPVLMLSYGYWKRHGADPEIVGRTFEMNDRVHTVVGVLPPLPPFPDDNDVFMPASACPFRSNPRRVENRDSRMMTAFAKLKEGVSLDTARADVAEVARRLGREHPESYPESWGYTARLTPVSEELTRQARPTLLVLLGAVGLVLLLACANVANLSLARLLSRQRELAVRAALGAGRRRLFRQLLTESLLLSLAGGALGLALALGTVDLLRRFVAGFTPRAGEIQVDVQVLIFTAVVSVGVGLLFGSVPALACLRNLPSCFSESGGRVSSGPAGVRLRSALVVAQVAVSLVLLVGAGLMVRSLHRLQSVDLGFNPERVLTMMIDLNWSKYDRGEKVRAFQDDLLERVRAHPGVLAAALAHTFPLNGMGPMNDSFQIQGRAIEDGQPLPRFDFRAVTPGYFETIGIEVLSGRGFTDSDRGEAPSVAVVNRSMAERHWDGKDPVGTMISTDGGETWTRIVGLVDDVKQYGPDSPAADEIYTPLAQTPTRVASLLVRTSAEPKSVAREMTAAVYAVDPEQPVANVRTLQELRGEWLSRPRVTTLLLALFAGLALLVTAAGVAGLLAFTVSSRTHEIGIRMALGASRGQVVRSILAQGLGLTGLGLGLGLAAAALGSRLLEGLLFEIDPGDPLTFVAVAALLAACSMAASLVPARRASGIDPMRALRTD